MQWLWGVWSAEEVGGIGVVVVKYIDIKKNTDSEGRVVDCN